jgi:hypothetical protein
MISLRNIARNYREWWLSDPLRAAIGQYLHAPIIYLLFEFVINPVRFLNNPLDGLDKLLILNAPVSVGFGIYVWFKNRKSSNE